MKGEIVRVPVEYGDVEGCGVVSGVVCEPQPVLSGVRPDGLLDNDGDELLGDLDVDPRVRAQLHVLVPELSRGLGEGRVVDVHREVLAGWNTNVPHARQVDLGLGGAQVWSLTRFYPVGFYSQRFA